MDKLLVNERVLRALLDQAQNQLSAARHSGPLSFQGDGDWLDVKEELNLLMQDLVIATAVIDELWQQRIRKEVERLNEDPVATEIRE